MLYADRTANVLDTLDKIVADRKRLREERARLTSEANLLVVRFRKAREEFEHLSKTMAFRKI